MVGRSPDGESRYAFGDKIARDGMVLVYRATDVVLVREVAMKVLAARFAPDAGTSPANRPADTGDVGAAVSILLTIRWDGWHRYHVHYRRGSGTGRRPSRNRGAESPATTR